MVQMHMLYHQLSLDREVVPFILMMFSVVAQNLASWTAQLSPYTIVSMMKMLEFGVKSLESVLMVISD